MSYIYLCDDVSFNLWGGEPYSMNIPGVWQGETEVLGEKPVALLLSFSPQSSMDFTGQVDVYSPDSTSSMAYFSYFVILFESLWWFVFVLNVLKH